MANFNEKLNRDGDQLATSARYDPGAATWLHDSAMFVKNAGGVWVPVSQTDPMPATLLGRSLTQAPVHGAKTVTTVAASLFAGVARLTGRNYLAVYNESVNTVYVGGSGVTTANGFPILPGDSRVFSIDPAADFGIYAISASNSAVRVEEGK